MPDIEERIRLLLNLAKDEGATGPEASLALERAHDLLRKHNLDMAEVEAGGAPAPDVVDEEFTMRPGKWRSSLINVVARHNYCNCILSSKTTMRIIGRPHNVAATVGMSIWLQGQIADLTIERWGIESTVTDTTNGLREQDWKDSFAFGITNKVNERLAAQKAHEEGEDENSRALTLDLGSENKEFIKGRYGKLVYTKVSYDRVAYDSGLGAGEKVSISASDRQVGGRRLQLPGG